MVSTSSASPVGAVYDRALFLESTKYARSQTAPTVSEVLRIDIKGLNHLDMPRPERHTQVYDAVGANLVIAVCTMIAAGVTGSSAMLSQGVHSIADTGSELLLLLGP